MSLSIDVERVEQVLLADGKWHRVMGKSFTTGAYEFEEQGRTIVAGGRVAGVPATGAEWREAGGSIVACPLTAVLAVRLAPARKSGKRSTGRKPLWEDAVEDELEP
jgi:hypothetical protein